LKRLVPYLTQELPHAREPPATLTGSQKCGTKSAAGFRWVTGDYSFSTLKNRDLSFPSSYSQSLELLVPILINISNPDFIIIGGGIGGCVVASRLHGKYPPASILLIEAGPDVSKHPLIVNGSPLQLIQHSVLDWDFQTVPQKHLSNKACFAAAGKAPGGGSAINACTSYNTNPNT
jgi:hypothetical protein